MMTYRELTTVEVMGISGEFLSRGFSAPGPNTLVVGAFEGERLLGFQVLQLALHAEPLVVYDPHCVRGLNHAVEQKVRDEWGQGSHLFAFALGRTAELAKGLGFSRRDEFIFEKVV